MSSDFTMAVRRKKRIAGMREWVIVGCLLLLLFIVGRWTYHAYGKKIQAQEALDEMAQKQARLEERLDRVETRNKTFATDTGIQDFLVERRGLIREGERVLILVEEKKRPERREEIEESTRRWWQWWRE